MKPRVLVTNDDGAGAPGILALMEALEDSFDVVMVAPSKEWSTTSHTLTLMRPIEVHEVSPRRFVVEGTPTDCVHLALKQILPRKPDLVISGINRGANMGEDITYSGTVAAAMEACLCGAKSFAVSCVDYDRPEYNAAAQFASRLARMMIKRRLPAGIFFNVNVPSVGSVKDLRGAQWTKLGRRIYPLDVRAVPGDPSRNSAKFYVIGGIQLEFKDIPGSDFHATHRGRASITPLHLDLTCYPLMSRVKKWKLF